MERITEAAIKLTVKTDQQTIEETFDCVGELRDYLTDLAEYIPSAESLLTDYPNEREE